MSIPRVTDELIQLTEQQLDMLQWLGEWTPDVHRATKEAWDYKRTWPPGWRSIPDLGVNYVNTKVMAKCKREMSIPPKSCLKVGPSVVASMLPLRLVEGVWRCAALTPRGRAALKHHGRPCPEFLKSHSEVFDDRDLRPRPFRGMYAVAEKGAPKHNELLPDTPEIWRKMMVEYLESDYRQKGTLSNASASLTPCSGQVALHGSLREHHRFLTFRIRNGRGQEVCEAYFSLEGLADLLTSQGAVPVTVDSYYGSDGMRRSEPAPKPASMMRRMHARLEHATDRTSDQITELMDVVREAKMGVRIKEKIIHELEIALSCGDSGHAYAVQEAHEEISTAVESMLLIAQDRAALAGEAPLAALSAMNADSLLNTRGITSGRLPAGSKTTVEVAAEREDD